ncbi:tetratricopeptide repeat protein, partial [Caulobacter sp. 17J65-9]|uniref:tetratricopeptide repeat protein n=1 Tax=Caulobacter sp. 17J65-9 TaxID=2709382 RepID=UPI0013CC170E
MSADDAVSVSAKPTGTNDEQAAAALARVEAGAAQAGDLQYLLAHGSALTLGERFEEGAQLYRTLAARFEDRPRLLAGLARCEAALGDGDAAREALEKARRCGLPSEIVSQVAALIPGEGRDWASLRAEAEAAIAAGATDA